MPAVCTKPLFDSTTPEQILSNKAPDLLTFDVLDPDNP